MSLIASRKLLPFDPYRYLRDLLTRLPQLSTEVDDDTVRKLLSVAWLIDHPDGNLNARN